ncbi:MAG: M64 family metallopeptidase [Aquabacterium sp.]|nr:M64 family metallopeptidase [Aquabacterium sp.]
MGHTPQGSWCRLAFLWGACALSVNLAQADQAHYLIVREQASGSLSVASHRFVQVTGKVAEQTSQTPALRNEVILSASMQDKQTGATVFRTKAIGSPWVRAEFHGAAQIDGHILPAHERLYVVRLPVQAGKMLHLQAISHPVSALITSGTSGASGTALVKAAPPATLDIDLDQYSVSSGASRTTAPAPAPAGTESGVLIRNGSPANRLDLLVVAEGYTLGQKAQFMSQAADLANQVLSIPPYRDFKQLINVQWLFVPSKQSGADKPDCSETPGAPVVLVDTAFDATYCSSGLRRALVVDNSKVLTAAGDVADWDLLMVLVNDSEYGGTGGQVAVTSTNTDSAQVMQHELGHSFSQLADEYDSPYPGYGLCSDVPGSPLGRCETNVTDTHNRASLKWSRWLDASTTVPTVAALADPIATGLWQGARYQSSGMYRQCFNGLMRMLGVPFCHVDSEAFVKRLFSGGWGMPAAGVSLIEPGALPLVALIKAEIGSSVAFRAALAGSNVAGGLTVSWWVDGQQIKTAAAMHGQSQAFRFKITDGLSHKVVLKVRDNTALTLDAPISSKEWAVQGIASVPGAPTISGSTATFWALTLTFTPPAVTGGSPITGYSALCTSPGRSNIVGTSTTSPMTMKALPSGVTYSCTVAAISAAGQGTASAAINIRKR